MKNSKSLENIAKQVRKEIILMSARAQSAHMGGALSCVEILTALYFSAMRINPKNPKAKDRDRLIFSKAHDAKALYAVLCLAGFFPKKILEGYEVNGGKLPGHSVRDCVPGVEISAGSLGHGLSIASGIALAAKRDENKFRTFAILSDGECQEGSTWEAVLFAGHHRLDNLVAIIDYNKLQGFGRVEDILRLEPFAQKWKAFGWEPKEVNGHNLVELSNLLHKLPLAKGKPTVVIAHTIKGLGGPKQHINKISSQYIPPTWQEAKELIAKLS